MLNELEPLTLVCCLDLQPCNLQYMDCLVITARH